MNIYKKLAAPFILILVLIFSSCQVGSSNPPAGDDDDDLDPVSGTNFVTVLDGTSSDDRALAVTVDSFGNIFIAGFTSGDLDGTNNGGKDIFIAKFEKDGDEVWVKQYGTSADEEAKAIALDSTGNIYVAGYTKGDFDGSGTGTDIFIAKYNPSGEEQWKDQLSSDGNEDIARAIVVSGSFVYIAGETDGNLDSETNNGGIDAFLVKYPIAGSEPDSTYLLGTASTDIAYGIDVDSSGDIYVVGYTMGVLDGISQGQEDMFVSKFDGSSFSETAQAGTSGTDIATAIKVSGANVYVTGLTDGDISGEGGSTGTNDVFLMFYDSTNLINTWTKQVDSSSVDIPYGIDLDEDGDVYITGETTGNFDGNSAKGNEDVFVLKYSSDGTKEWSQQLGTSSPDIGHGIAKAGSFMAIAGESGGNLDDKTNKGSQDYFIVKYEKDGDLR